MALRKLKSINRERLPVFTPLPSISFPAEGFNLSALDFQCASQQVPGEECRQEFVDFGVVKPTVATPFYCNECGIAAHLAQGLIKDD